MGKSTDEIELEIKAQREELFMNLGELEVKTKALTDWRTYFAKSPATMLGVAFGCGFAIAAISGNGRHRRMVMHREIQQTVSSPRYAQIHETWDILQGALIGVAAMRLKDFVSELIPGFKEQIDISESKRRV